MPRRHAPPKHTRYAPMQNERFKTRYTSEVAARKQAELLMLMRPHVTLHVYTTGPRRWYLSSQNARTPDGS